MHNQANQLEKVFIELRQLKNKITEQVILTKELLDLEEAATYLNLSGSTLYKHSSNKTIPSFKPSGKKIYFRRSDLDDWVIGKSSSLSDKELKEAKKNVSDLLNSIS